MHEKRIDSLDGLRGLAAISVVIMHVYYVWGVNQSYPQFSMYIEHFGFAVHLFYILSGFTLCFTYFNNSDNQIIKIFLLKRFFRIAPLFYICILLNFITIKFFNINVDIYSPVSIFTNIFLIFNLYPSHMIAESLTPAGWSIGVEWIFYLMFPLLIVLMKRKKYVFFVMLLLSLLYPILHKYIPNILIGVDYTYFFNYFFLNFAPFFLFGMSIYGCYKYLTSIESTSLMLIIYFFIFFISYIIFNKIIVNYLSLIWGLNFILIIICLIIHPLPILSSGLFVFFGKISFSVYLLHGILMGAMGTKIASFLKIFSFLGNDNIGLIIYLMLYFAILFIISTISYYLIETPFNRFGLRVVKSMKSV